jgi:4,5-dihydroxyphthalate decarboxylase
VLSGDEHVAEYKAPSNVVPIGEGKKMADMLISGELAAAVGIEVDHPDIQPLIADGDAAGLKALRERGHYPINHLVVIKDELIEKYPELAADVFNSFAESKRLYVEKLKAGKLEKMTAADETTKHVMDVTGSDPLPYGIGPNRKVLEELLGHALKQGIITRPMTVEELFVPSTHKLVG